MGGRCPKTFAVIEMSITKRNRPQGKLHLRIKDPGGGPLTERWGRNIVLRQGADIVARLFSGTENAASIDQVQVGFAREGATVETTSLTGPEDSSIPAGALVSAVASEDFSLITDRPGAIQVMIASVFKPTVELKDVTEAGLLAGGRLYNQVVFEPVTLRPGQDITFFWEIDFPFGH